MNPYQYPVAASLNPSPDRLQRLSNARADILMSRRKEKLKYDLMSGMGPHNEDLINEAIARHGDSEIGQGQGGKNKSYQEIYETMQNKVY